MGTISGCVPGWEAVNFKIRYGKYATFSGEKSYNILKGMAI